MAELLNEAQWKTLIRWIKDGKCTPFLGAGIGYGVLPLGAQIAKKWADEYTYPLTDTEDLIKVAQFLAVENYPMFPKEEIIRMFEDINKTPDFTDANEPHRVLADLPLPVYITTNYDSFMEMALSKRHRDPKSELCRWNVLTKKLESRFDKGYTPTPANPVVFHLHGYMEYPYSLVLTEDDYFDFLVNVSGNESIIPPPIEAALTETSLLFIGYRLADWNFRVILQGFSRLMEKGLGRIHMAVMVPPAATESEQQKVQAYLSKYYEKINVQIYWGTARDFLTELKVRWNAAQ